MSVVPGAIIFDPKHVVVTCCIDSTCRVQWLLEIAWYQPQTAADSPTLPNSRAGAVICQVK